MTDDLELEARITALAAVALGATSLLLRYQRAGADPSRLWRLQRAARVSREQLVALVAVPRSG